MWPEIILPNQVTRSRLFIYIINRCLQVSRCVQLFYLVHNKLFSSEKHPFVCFDAVSRLISGRGLSALQTSPSESACALLCLFTLLSIHEHVHKSL